ncbi:glycosyltransferase, partial [Clostridioides difficile]
VEKERNTRKKIYISLGTVNNKNINFYKNCIEAFKDNDIDVIMSVGNNTEISQLGNIPKNFKVENKFNQLEVLQEVNGFISHCGMNSVNESIYYGVPLILFPQQSEQKMVCRRVAELGAGFVLKNDKPQNIKEAVLEVINNTKYE